MEFFHKPTNFPFMATRKLWYSLSILMVIGSIFSFYYKGLNLAIDFTGGVSIEAKYPGTADIEGIRTSLVNAGFHEPLVQNFGSSREVAIRLPPDPPCLPRRSARKWTVCCRAWSRAASSLQSWVRKWARSCATAPSGRCRSR